MSESVNSVTSVSASVHSHLSAEVQADRRKQIRKIMANPNIPQAEKSRRVQALMDGRSRRASVSSTGNVDSVDSKSLQADSASQVKAPTEYIATMARAAAAAAEYYSSEDEGDAIMSNTEDNMYGYNDHVSQPSSPTKGLAQGTYRTVHGRSYSMQDWSDDGRDDVTHSSLFLESPAQVSRLMENLRPKCEHYERNCTIVASCCGLAFGCRICHDECLVLPPPLNYCKTEDNPGNIIDHARKQQQNTEVKAAHRRFSMPLDTKADEEEQHHLIDRFAIKDILCRNCYKRQSSKTNTCIKCGIIFAEYHCAICNLWMSAGDDPYHCHDCGFCRVGGRENFRHCRDCGMCIDRSLFDDHNCKAGKYMRDCPICQEDLFSSRQASHEMPCGHAIHWHCFKQLTSYDTRCPVCKKTAETPENMSPTWSAIAMGIALQPVPTDLARVVHIVCNDCEQRDENRRWHFLGTRCMNCLSFNTVVEQTVITGPEAADFLDNYECSRSHNDGVPTNIAMLSLWDTGGSNQNGDQDTNMEDPGE